MDISYTLTIAVNRENDFFFFNDYESQYLITTTTISLIHPSTHCVQQKQHDYLHVHKYTSDYSTLVKKKL